jgi:hypothetical protein
MLAQRILKEQEEILELLENSAFLTHSLTKLSAEGLSEQQNFIRAFEEVERAKLRLLFGPCPSREDDQEEDRGDRNDENDTLESQSSISSDSLEVTPRDQVKTLTTLPGTMPSFELTLREDIFKQMDHLLGSDDESESESEGGEDGLEELQQELQKRFPSRLEFSRAEPSLAQQSERCRDFTESDEESDEDEREEVVKALPPVTALSLPSNCPARLVALLLDSLPEWLVLCVRSYRSVFLNNEAATGSQEGEGLTGRLERSARKFLQVERYVERLEREVWAVRGRQATGATLLTAHGSRGGRSQRLHRRESSQKELMSRSTSHLSDHKQGQRPGMAEGLMKDDHSVRYSSAAESESQAVTTVRKGRMLLLSAAISFGEVAGQLIAQDVVLTKGDHVL